MENSQVTPTKKPNCYKCIHRRNLAGSAHSACAHPSNMPALESPLATVLGILGGVGRLGPSVAVDNPLLAVKGNSHGIAHGWFNWPMNFDPTWLEACNGFEQKTEPEGGDTGEAKMV
jgi:hypothetical protein